MAGYQLLGDAFDAPTADASWNPGNNEGLKTQVPEIGTIQSIVEQARLADPRHETEAATQKAQGKISSTRGQMAVGEKAIAAHHGQKLSNLVVVDV